MEKYFNYSLMGLLQQEITIKDLVSQLMTKQMRFAKMKYFNY
jgi:hypothetical protein